MKKILFLIVGVFAVMGIVSCNGNDTENIAESLTVAEALNMPTNLSINETSKTLSWDAVENADAYAVYVDGSLEAEVDGTSFDFSEITEDRIVFRVKAVSNGVYQNSNMSTNIAFVANREAVVLALKTSLVDNDMNVNDPDGFAEELASKGMTAGDLDDMMITMENMESIDTMNDMSDIYGVIDGTMDDMDIDMIEALISSLIKVELPVNLQEQINDYKELDGECAYESWQTTECYRYYDFTQEIDQLESILDFIENNGDEAVRSAMIVVEYLMTVQDGIESDIIDNIEDIAETEEPSAATVTMMLSVKDDMVNLLKEELPAVEDFVMINTTMMAFAQVLSQDAMDLSYVSIPKQSAATHVSFELFFNFLLEMDQAYMQSLVDLLVEDNSDHVKEFIKSNIALIDTYLENNQTMIDQMNNLYTDEEKEAMYTEVMVLQTYSTVMSLNIFINVVDGKEENDLENLEEDIRAIYEQYSDFDSMMILSDMMDENMNQLLDDIIESDYAIVDSMVDLITLQAQSSSLHDDYQFLVQDDDGGDGLNFMISETLEPGDYELRVSAYNVYYDMYLYDLEVMVDGNSLVSETVSLENVRNYIYNFTITETSEFMAYSQGNEVDTVGYLGWKEISNSEEELDEVEVITSFMSDLMTLMSPMVEEMTDEEYQAFIETVYSNVIIQLMAQNLVIDDPEVQTYIDAINIIKDSMDEVATNQLDLFQNLMNVLSKTEYMADIETYANLQGDAGTNASVILLANVFIDFYEESEDDLDAIIAEFLGAIDNADMMVLLDISPQMVSQLETMMTGYFDDLYTQAEIIKNYDYDSLTTLQEQNINTFILALSGMSE